MVALKTFMEPVLESQKDARDYFADELLARGIDVHELGPTEYDALVEGGRNLDEVVEKLGAADLVLHDSRRFVWSLAGVDIRSDNPMEMHERRVGMQIDRNLNFSLYKRAADRCFHIYPPNGKNVTRKDQMPGILRELGVPTPRTVAAEDFDNDFFPAYLKKTNGSCGDGVFLVQGPREFRAPEHGKYIVQEAYLPPTIFASSVRFVCFGNSVIGGMVYYNPNRKDVVNGSGARGVPLTEPLRRKMTPEERYVLSEYRPDEIARIAGYAGRIGEFGMQNGYPALMVEAMVDRDTGKIGVIDVNAYFSLGIFHVLYNNDKESTAPDELHRLAARKFAQAYLN